MDNAAAIDRWLSDHGIRHRTIELTIGSTDDGVTRAALSAPY